MSKSYIDKILLNPKKYNPYSHMKPAVKDGNFYFANCISFNMMENLTQFKNKEISISKLNLRLIGNLSLLIAKKNVITKKRKLKDKIKLNSSKNNKNLKNIKKNNNNEENINVNILEGYECYIPTKRIPYFNKRPFNEKSIARKESSKVFRKNYKEKIPPNLRNINFFRPSGRFFTINKIQSNNTNTAQNKPSKRKSRLSNISITERYSDGFSNSIAYTNTNTNVEDINDGNDFSGENSLFYGELDESNIYDKSFFNSLKAIPTFPKYSQLCELIECPFDDALPPEMKYKQYLIIFNEFMNEEDYDDNINNNENNINIFQNNDNSIINISQDTNDDNNNNEMTNNKKAFIINPSKYKDYMNSDKNNFLRTSSKSGKLLKVNANIFSNYYSSIINKTSISDDNEDIEEYKNDESLFSFFETDEKDMKNPSKKINPKIKKLLPKSAIKYINKMSNQYIFLMYEKFKIINDKYELAKNYLYDEIMLKKLFIQILKTFLLNIGISTKKFYEKLIKFEIHKKGALDFEHFMSIFELILLDNNKENLRFKFLFLLKIVSPNDNNDQILTEKEMDIFFDLIGCERVYINNFCEILGERLILRYKAIYNNEYADKNIADKSFIYRKIKIILESFLDVLDS